jgi:transposase
MDQPAHGLTAPFKQTKQCRRIATHYDKLAVNYLAFIKLASLRIRLLVKPSAPSFGLT